MRAIVRYFGALFVAMATVTAAQAMHISVPGDRLKVLKDEFGDVQVSVNTSRITSNGRLRRAPIRNKDGDETFFVTDCGELFYVVRYRSEADFLQQINNLDDVFDRMREHVHPGSLVARIEAVVCGKSSEP